MSTVSWIIFAILMTAVLCLAYSWWRLLRKLLALYRSQMAIRHRKGESHTSPRDKP